METGFEGKKGAVTNILQGFSSEKIMLILYIF